MASPELKRVVVAVDPSGTSGKDAGDEIGIVVAGVGVDGLGYVLHDASLKASPEGWARRAANVYHRYGADRLVAEKNYGGALVEHTIRTADPNVSYKEVVASRGKAQRAEPVAALFEQGRVKLVGSFPEMENQLAAFTSSGYAGDGSPDRADAVVWAISELMVTPEPVFYNYIMVGLGGILGGREPEPDPETNYQEAKAAAARGELRGAALTWFLRERRRRSGK